MSFTQMFADPMISEIIIKAVLVGFMVSLNKFSRNAGNIFI